MPSKTTRALSTAAPRPRKTRTPAPRSRAARLDPEVRRELILDKAAALVMERGLSGCSLEAVAAESGVSKALVYKYYPNRDSLFGALLHREFDSMRDYDARQARDQNVAPDDPRRDINDILRSGVHGYLVYLSERGTLFRTLINDAGVAGRARDALRAGQNANMRFWTERTTAAYGIPYDLARVGVIMTSLALEGGLGSVKSGKVSVERLADFWTTFVRAGWKAAAVTYGNQRKPRRR